MVRQYKRKLNKKRFFYPREYLKFLSVIPKDAHKFYYEFLLHTGMRHNEARNVNLADIDFERETIFIRKPKNNKQRTIQISTAFKNRLQAYVRTNKITTTLGIPTLPFMDTYIKKYAQKAEIQDYMDFSCHNIRKTLENWLLALNINTMAIVAHCGHQIDTAQGYYIATSLMQADDKVLIRSILDNLLNK